MSYSITVKKLNKSSKDTQFLKNISFKLKAGSITPIIGYPGSGKSMLIKSLLGLERVDEGSEIQIEAKEISYLPQNFKVDPYLSVSDNIRILESNDVSNMDEVLEILELTDKSIEKAGVLSSLDQKKVALASVILRKYDLMMLDGFGFEFEESVNNSLIKYFKELSKEETTIVYSTSDTDLPFNTSVIVMYQGKAQSGKLSDVMSSNKTKDLKSLLNKLNEEK